MNSKAELILPCSGVPAAAADVADRAGGQVYTSGSYRLGINEKGMDIDTICVAPRHVTREDFFDSLKVILEDHDSVENLVAVATATVPIIPFDFDDVNIELLFASLPLDSVPPSMVKVLVEAGAVRSSVKGFDVLPTFIAWETARPSSKDDAAAYP